MEKATGKGRILARTDNSTVILNQALHIAMDAKTLPGSEKFVQFVGFKDGKPARFLLQVGKADDAVKLRDAINVNKAK